MHTVQIMSIQELRANGSVRMYRYRYRLELVQINLLQMTERVIAVLTVEQSKFIPKNMRLYTKNSIQVTSLFVTSVTPFVFEVDERWHFANW